MGQVCFFSSRTRHTALLLLLATACLHPTSPPTPSPPHTTQPDQWDLALDQWDLFLDQWDLFLVHWDLFLDQWDLALDQWDLFLVHWDLFLVLFLDQWDLFLDQWDLDQWDLFLDRVDQVLLVDCDWLSYVVQPLAPQTTANIQQVRLQHTHIHTHTYTCSPQGQSSYSAVSTQPRQSQQVTIPLEVSGVHCVWHPLTGCACVVAVHRLHCWPWRHWATADQVCLVHTHAALHLVAVCVCRGQSGCEVTIEDPKPGSSERIITIYGTLGAIQFAQQLMQNRYAEELWPSTPTLSPSLSLSPVFANTTTCEEFLVPQNYY